MKLEKKHWIIICVIVVIILVWYFFLRKKKTESGYTVPRGGRPAGTRPTYPIPPQMMSGAVSTVGTGVGGGATSKTYVYSCSGPPPFTGFSNKPSGNCVGKGKEEILKTL